MHHHFGSQPCETPRRATGGCLTETLTLTDVEIPSNATSILVLLEGAGGEAQTGVGSSSSFVSRNRTVCDPMTHREYHM